MMKLAVLVREGKEMSKLRDQVWTWYQQGELKPEQMPKALALAAEAEPAVAWRETIEQLLLWLGVLFVGAGVIIFFAFNWQDLDKFGKFALVQALLLACMLAYAGLRWREREQNPAGIGPSKANACLLGLSLMIGALLALVGQTYQTGADPWQLFAIWSLCLVPLALLAGFDLLWLKLLALVNLSMALYFHTWPQAWGWFDADVFTLVFISAFNGLLYIGFLAAQHYQWQRLHAPICQSLSILVAMVTLTVYGCWQALEISASSSFVYYFVYACAVFALARWVLHQLLPLALVCFSAIAVSTVWLGVNMLDSFDEFGVFFFIAMYIVMATAAVSVWLTKIRAQWLPLQPKEDDEEGETNGV